MKKRLLLILFICFAGIFVSAFAFKDVKASMTSIEYTLEDLIGNSDSANGFSADVRTRFAPGDNWDTHLEIAGGKLLQSTIYCYEDNDQDKTWRTGITGSVNVQVGFASEVDETNINKDDVGIRRVIYDLFKDKPSDIVNTENIKLSDYFEYFPVSVGISLGNVNWSDQEEVARRIEIGSNFADYIKVPVPKDMVVHVDAITSKDSDGEITVICSNYGYDASDYYSFSDASWYCDLSGDSRGVLAVPGNAIYYFEIDLSSVSKSIIKKILDLSEDSFAACTALKDRSGYSIITEDSEKNGVYLYDMDRQSFVFSAESKSYAGSISEAEIFEEDGFIAYINPDYVYVLEKTADGRFVPAISISGLQNDKNSDVFFSLLTKPYHLPYYGMVYAFMGGDEYAAGNIAYRDGKLFIVRGNYIKISEDQDEYSFKIYDRTVSVSPDIIVGIIGSDGAEYVGALKTNFNTVKILPLHLRINVL